MARARRNGPPGLLPALVLPLLAGPAACADADPVPARSRPLELRLALLDGAGAERTRHAQGEPIALVLRVRNASDRTQRIELASARTHDFAVAAADGREVWRWSRGRSFAQMLGHLELAPGEAREFRARWEPGPEPGAYVASGALAGPDGPHAPPLPFDVE